MPDVHEEGWQEEVGEKSNLKWYKLAEEDFGRESYVKEFGGKRSVRVRFRLRTVPTGLLVTRRGVVCVRMLNVCYVMKVLWKVLCISCCTVEWLQVVEEDY